MRKGKGFTLLEVMLVIIMLLTVFFPLLQLMATGLSASEETKSTNTAVLLAQKRLEEIKSESYVNVTSEASASIASYPEYNRQTNVTSTPDASLKDVKITVSWGTGGPQSDIITLETYISSFEQP